MDNELISKKFSWFGTNHVFDVEENGEWVEYVLRTRFDFNGMSANLTRDGIQIIKGGKGDIDMVSYRNGSLLYHESELVV